MSMGMDEHRHDHGDEHCQRRSTRTRWKTCCHSAEEHHHGEDCTCGTCRDGHGHNHAEHHHHSHEGHHHADEVFTSWGMESPRKFTEAEVAFCLTALDSGDYGAVLRAKGIVPAADGTWLHFDYVPGEQDIRTGAADYTGRLCVIGAQLNEARSKRCSAGRHEHEYPCLSVHGLSGRGQTAFIQETLEDPGFNTGEKIAGAAVRGR